MNGSHSYFIRLAFVPDYLFLNARGLPFQQVQLGNGFFVNAAVQWTFRSSPED